jgi:hypothetical protein
MCHHGSSRALGTCIVCFIIKHTVSRPTFLLSSNIFVLIWNYCLCPALFRESVKRPWRDVKNILNSLQTLCNWKDFHGLMHLSMLTAERYVDFIMSHDMLSPIA